MASTRDRTLELLSAHHFQMSIMIIPIITIPANAMDMIAVTFIPFGGVLVDIGMAVVMLVGNDCGDIEWKEQ
jgi:hypothetical protein